MVKVLKSKKTDSRPLERKPSVPLKDLLGAIAIGMNDEDLFSSLANRLVRLEKELDENEKAKFAEISNGKRLNQVVRELLKTYDPDVIDEKTQALVNGIPEQNRTLAKVSLI